LAKNNILKQLRQCFTEIITEKDGRAGISPLEFIINLVFSYLGDTKNSSLENIRRQMKNQVGLNISRSAFWERLSRNRLKQFLKLSIAQLLKKLTTTVICDELAKKLKVVGIFIVDSCIFTLWDGAKCDFPGVSTTAGIKWHTCLDALSGKTQSFELSSSSTHDRNFFPDLETLRSKLVIMDLGYWDFNLLHAIKEVGGFFLSRIKSGAVIYITEIVQGRISQKYIGASLLSVPIQRKRSDIIEVMIEKVCASGTLNCRAIGFWNPCEKCYHWYLTNLEAPAHLIYPLYRLRWQIELVFKAVKQSLNANRLTSNNSNIIESLLLASIAAHLASHTILNLAIPHLTKMKQLAISVQRTAKIAALLASDFINFLVHGGKKNIEILANKIALFADEIFDPNYRHRESSLARIHRLLETLI